MFFKNSNNFWSFAECPEKVNIWWIILAIILAIVLIGLILLLIWKCFATIVDRREFAKFEKERQNAKWDTVSNFEFLFTSHELLGLL